MKKIMFIVGSFRKNSFNQQLAKHIQSFNYDADISILDYSQVPFFNQDLEENPPEIIETIRQNIKEVDGIWIITPEYNGQIPGVLKNLLDWLSRPLVKRDRSSSVLNHKPVTISSTAGNSAGIHARKSLMTLLENMSMDVKEGTGTGIVLTKESFITGQLQLSDQNRHELKKQFDNFMSLI